MRSICGPSFSQNVSGLILVAMGLTAALVVALGLVEWWTRRKVTHSTMGAVTGLLVTARWLELRLTPPLHKVAGAAASVAMLIIAFILVLYREANVVLSAD